MGWKNITPLATLRRLKWYWTMQSQSSTLRKRSHTLRESGGWCPILFSLTVYVHHGELKEHPLVNLWLVEAAVTAILELLLRWASFSSLIAYFWPQLQFLTDLSPPTRLLNNFCVAWDGRQNVGWEFESGKGKGKAPQDSASTALALSARLIRKKKTKALMNMTSGLEMLALAITICSEVSRQLQNLDEDILTGLLSRMGGSSLKSNQTSRNVWLGRYLVHF